MRAPIVEAEDIVDIDPGTVVGGDREGISRIRRNKEGALPEDARLAVVPHSFGELALRAKANIGIHGRSYGRPRPVLVGEIPAVQAVRGGEAFDALDQEEKAGADRPKENDPFRSSREEHGPSGTTFDPHSPPF